MSRVADRRLFRGNQPERVQVIAKTELKTDAANVALRAAAIVGVMYGFGFLLMPDAMFLLSGDPGVPANSGWVRWAGGFVLGIAIGPWLASEGWVKEQPFIAGVAAAFTLSGLALLYSAADRLLRRQSVECDRGKTDYPTICRPSTYTGT